MKVCNEISELLSNIKDEVCFLFVTATEIESKHLISTLKPMSNYDDLIMCFHEKNTYHLGKLGIYNGIHVQCSMGNSGRDSVINTVSEAIRLWNPSAVVMIGIAFGKDSKTQKIGDVLISQSIIDYEKQRVSKNKSEYRGNIVESGTILLNRFRNVHDWEFKNNDNEVCSKIIGKILSGEKLIDNEEKKHELFSQYPDAIGGEMEGIGIYSASERNEIHEWIIVKGICDWADGYKKENKKENQEIAIKSALSLCEKIFSIESFNDLKKK